MTIFRILDSRQCSSIQPLATDVSHRTVLEFRCILPAGHNGPHMSANSACWTNVDGHIRMIEEEGFVAKKRIINLGRLRSK